MNKEETNHNLLIIISDDTDFARAFSTFATALGMTWQWLDFSQLRSLPNLKPTAIVVSAGTAGTWHQQAQANIRDLFADTRVFGMGQGGADLYACLDLAIGSGHGAHFGPDAYGDESIELVQERMQDENNSGDDAALPKRYSGSELGAAHDINAIYDNGSPERSGFEGIARYHQDPHYWPICKQGSYLYWAFDGELEGLSDKGRALLQQLLAELIARPVVPLQEALVKHAYLQPGILSARLTEETEFGHQHHIQLRNMGIITATVTWNPPNHAMAVILNGPGQIGCYEREDGPSPLTILHAVTTEYMVLGTDWQISVKTFDKPTDYEIEYQLDWRFSE